MNGKEWAAVVLAALLAGCATTADLRTVQTDLNEARRIALENRNTIQEISDRLATKQEATQEPATKAESLIRDSEVVKSIRQSQAELSLRVENLSREVMALRGRVDEARHGLERQLKEVVDQRDLLVIRISAMEERLRLLAPTPAATVVSPAGQTATGPGAEDKSAPAQPVVPQTEGTASVAEGAKEDAVVLYRRGHELYKSKEFGQARELFRIFLDRFPTHEYAGHAQFWIGETFYSQEQYENAILAYEDVLRKYKNSEKTAAAMLKQGYAFAALGDEKTARIILDRVEQKYPGSKEAELAASKLKTLSKDR